MRVNHHKSTPCPFDTQTTFLNMCSSPWPLKRCMSISSCKMCSVHRLCCGSLSSKNKLCVSELQWYKVSITVSKGRNRIVRNDMTKAKETYKSSNIKFCSSTPGIQDVWAQQTWRDPTQWSYHSEPMQYLSWDDSVYYPEVFLSWQSIFLASPTSEVYIAA